VSDRSRVHAGVFDLDGTLVRGTSAERLLVPYLVRRRVIRGPQLAAALARLATLPVRGPSAALRGNKRWLTGAEVERVHLCMADFFADELAPRLCPLVLDEMRALRARGARIWLLTGAPDFVARTVAERLGMDGAVATVLEVEGGRFTGEIAGRHVYAGAKRDALAELAAAEALDLESSAGFADRSSDVAFLECFGRAFAVGADHRLRATAIRRGWAVIR
jgi:HAD superfamily hydrolase (TIGR01490 family)